MRILAVTKRRRERDRERERTRKFAREQTGFEIPRDRGIVFRRAFERARRETSTRRGIDGGRITRGDGFVLVGIDEHGHVREIFRSRTDERHAADIDLLDRFFERRTIARDRRFERIEIHDDDRDRRYAVLLRLGDVRSVIAIGENPAEHARMERLHATVEECGKAREIADVSRIDAVLDEVFARAAGRIDRHAAGFEFAREFDDARAIVHREQRGCVNRQERPPGRVLVRPSPG